MDELAKYARDYLRVINKNRNDGLCDYAVICDDKKMWVNANHACFAELCYSQFKDHARELEVKSKYIASTPRYRERSKHLTSYIRWLIQSSPFERAYVFKNTRDTIRHGVVVNTDLRHDLVGAALIAHRLSWEYPKIIDTWGGLVGIGVNPDVAYMFSAAVSYKDGVFYLSEISGGHTGLPTLRSGTVKNFLNRKESGEGEPTFRERSKYSDTAFIFCGEYQHYKFKELFLRKKRGQRKGVFTDIPFLSPESMLELIEEFIK